MAAPFLVHRPVTVSLTLCSEEFLQNWVGFLLLKPASECVEMRIHSRGLSPQRSGGRSWALVKVFFYVEELLLDVATSNAYQLQTRTPSRKPAEKDILKPMARWTK